MEPFDYLTYKQNKNKTQKSVRIVKNSKKAVYWTCFLTFAIFFSCVISFISSKTSKIDIEYGKMGTETINPINPEQENYDKLTIDKRLFLLQQQEKAPSKSRVVEENEQSEVISRSEFEQIKNNGIDAIQNQNTQTAITPETKNEIQKSQDNKLAMKPKIQLNPKIEPIGAINAPNSVSKVLIGRFSTVEQARNIQSLAAKSIEDTTPFVKKIGNVYTVQIGSYENFEIAKTVAGKLKANGFDVWILQ